MRDNLPRAKAVLISPRILQAGFIVGGSGGNAVLYARSGGGASWAGPAFYKLGTGSIGLQIGAESAEMVALVMTDKALNSFLSNSFKLGGDVSVAAGDFTGCLKIRERSVIDPDLNEFKYYCEGVGNVLVEEEDVNEELVDSTLL